MKLRSIFIAGLFLLMVFSIIASTGSLIRDLRDDKIARHAVSNALAVETLRSETFAGAATTDTVLVPGLESTGKVSAWLYFTAALPDSVGTYISVQHTTDSTVVVTRAAATAEHDQGYLLKIQSFK
jgi:hypothetical protein